MRFQFGISSWGGRRTPLYAFTEQGVAVLFSVLRNKRAIQVNIQIMDAFVRMRLIYTFARVSASTAMNVEDVYVQGKRTWVRLHEKGGKQHTLPCHHEL